MDAPNPKKATFAVAAKRFFFIKDKDKLGEFVKELHSLTIADKKEMAPMLASALDLEEVTVDQAYDGYIIQEGSNMKKVFPTRRKTNIIFTIMAIITLSITLFIMGGGAYIIWHFIAKYW